MSSNTTDSPSPADRSRQKVGQIAKERDILHAVAEVAGALIMVLSNNGEIVFFNRACETLTGYTAQEVKGRRPWTLLVCPEQVAEVEAVFAGLKAGSLPVKKEHCWQARDGSLHLISWTNTAMFDKAGKLEYIIAAGLDTTEQQVIEKALRRRSRELAERVKELNCLYEISRLREQQELLMPEVLQQVVEIIPPSWTYPQIARARIILRGKAFISKDFKESRWSMNSLLKACGEQVGMVEVFYLEQRPKKDEGPFCTEERRLLNAIAERLGRVIEHKEHEEQLREYQQQLRHLASELSLAEERDRRRFAQELHDRIGQLLAVAKIKLAKLIDAQQETSDPLGELMEMLEIAIHETRSLTFELSPPVLQELGFEAALAWLVTKFQNQHGIATTFTDDEQPKPLIADLQVVLFQAVRELLHNTAKYSQADNAAVSISRQNNYLVVEVSDDGIGFDAKTVLSRCCKEEGFGLFSIRERLSHFGGTMEVRSALKRGARITLTAPLESAATAIASSSTPAPAHAPRDSIHVLLVDDHKIAREGIRSLLADCLDIEVVAEAADGEEAIRLVRERAPEVVVMDAAMPGMGGVEATRRIMAGFPATKVVALSMHTDRQYVTDMLAAGVAGYLLKDCAQEDLAQAIRAVNAQLMFFSPGIAENVVREHHLAAATTDASVESLTSREREVLTLLAEGFNSKQIASRCRISTKTVESHRQHIAKKLNLHSVAKLTKYAIRKGLTSLEL